MGKGMNKMIRAAKRFADVQLKLFTARHGHKVMDLLELPLKVIFAPFTLPFDIAGAASRGFHVPELASHLSFSAVFVVATLGTYDIALELGRKVLCKSGQKATAERVAKAIADNKAELVHLPSAIDLPTPLPSKDCPSCDGTGVMSCPECKHRLQVTISADDIMEPPWKAFNVLRKMDYPYENIIHSMKDPKIAAFWLITMPQVLGGFSYDDDVKQKIWWAYEESMRYDQLRDIVAKRKPGWENLQNALITLDPIRARDDPVIVKNVPYYKAKKALEAEVMKLDVPPRPDNWGELELPLSRSSWTDEELKDPKRLLEMTTLLNAQREMANKLLDAQWEEKWRQDKLNALLEEKVQPYVRSIDKGVLPQSIVIPRNDQENKKKKRRWWFF